MMCMYIYTYIYSLLESIRILISPWSSDYNPIIFMVYPVIIPLKTTHSKPISPESPHKTGRIHIQNAKTAGSRHPKRSPLRAVHGRGAAHLKLTKVSAPGRTRGEKTGGGWKKMPILGTFTWYHIYNIWYIYIYICMCVWTYIYIYNIIKYIYIGISDWNKTNNAKRLPWIWMCWFGRLFDCQSMIYSGLKILGPSWNYII